MSLITIQHALLANKSGQTERLSAELKRILDGKPPYYIASVAKTALKLISLADKAGIEIRDLLQQASENTETNQKWELKAGMSETEVKALKEAQRKELARITAAGHMQNIYMAVINRATESLCQVQNYIIGADGGNAPINWLPTSDDLVASLTELRNLTMSYAHDMAEIGEHIERHDTPLTSDCFEVKTQKDALLLIQAFTNKLMESAISSVDVAFGSVPSADGISDWERKDRIEWLSAFGMAGASLSQYATQLLTEAVRAIGSVTITSRTTSTMSIVPQDMHAALTALTKNQANYKLN